MFRLGNLCSVCFHLGLTAEFFTWEGKNCLFHFPRNRKGNCANLKTHLLNILRCWGQHKKSTGNYLLLQRKSQKANGCKSAFQSVCAAQFRSMLCMLVKRSLRATGTGQRQWGASGMALPGHHAGSYHGIFSQSNMRDHCSSQLNANT